ncbi:MAG TPA: hypothetical protein VK533_15140 [Sphingomonas sp.]|uniref:hypothetical protein n=1 Tax=Sphingomonas sp. TaxID=28214 RepID=UPI002C017706|nr:hypothetical protein [Sphingomonas sp.]HMI20869.1 hypothetical protein [Sphingomonas sp.]
MTQHSLLAAPVARVSEHLVAIGCVRAGQLYVDHFGMDVRHWPLALFSALIVTVYGLGLVTARWLWAVWQRRRGRAILGPVLQPKMAISRPAAKAALVGGIAVVGVLAILVVANRRKTK